MNFYEGRKIVGNLNLSSKRNWHRYMSQSRINNLPTNPDRVYDEWVNWGDWLGIENVIGSKHKYHFNCDFFSKWSFDMAYVLGFWFADGCICKKVFTTSQHKAEKYLLENILSVMESDYPISSAGGNGNVLKIAMFSDKIVRDIKNLGGKERKSFDVKFPSVPKKYLPDFIRGLWDGDGCIFYNKKDRSYESHYVSASEKFIIGLRNALRREIHGLVGGKKRERNIKNGKAYYLNFYKNDTCKIGRFIYGGNSKLRMKRKQDKFMDAMEISKPKEKK